MAQHLKYSTRAGSLGEHQDGEEHQTAVRNGGVGIDVLQVGLYARAKCTIDHGDTREDEEYPAQFLRCIGQEVHGNTEATIATEFHQHTCVKHGYGRRRGGVTVGTPSVEGEEGTKNAKADESHREPNALLGQGNSRGTACVVSNVEDVHRIGTCSKIDTEDTHHQEGRTAHKHERQFHGRVFLATTTPDTDKEVHGNERNLVEHEHGKHVDGDEEAEHTHRKEGEPEEVFLGERLKFPRSEGSREDDDGGKQKHHYANAVDTYLVVNMKRREPFHTIVEEHGVRVAAFAGCQEGKGQIDSVNQECRTACDHHTPDLVERACGPQTDKHHQGDEHEYG